MNASFAPMDEPNWRLGGEIREFIGSSSRSNEYPPGWGACLRAASRGFRANQLRHGLLAVGRLQLPSGTTVDHAWLIDRVLGTSIVIDSASRHPGTSYEPLALFDGDLMWTAAPTDELENLRPQFFISIHSDINNNALKGIFDFSLIDDVNRVNYRVDDPWTHPNYDPREHFDNSMVLESIALLDDRLRWDGETPLHTVAPGSSEAVTYGLACHAIADFYAHSNFAAMALAYSGDLMKAPTLDEAVRDPKFVDFVTERWTNSTMWTQHEGYASPDPPTFGTGFDRCLFTGGYGCDSWLARPDVPHHNVFAVDAPYSALVDAPKIQRRQNPFAYLGDWTTQLRLRTALATRHVRNAVKRAQSDDHAPFLGAGVAIPPVLRPPTWVQNGTSVADAHDLPSRGTDGSLVPRMA